MKKPDAPRTFLVWPKANPAFPQTAAVDLSGFVLRVPSTLAYNALMITLRTPRPDEAAILTELCLRSKAVWGYDEEFMLACRNELTLTRSAMQSSHLKVAEIDGDLVGMAQVSVRSDIAELDKLFVEPTRLRSGSGRALFVWAKNNFEAFDREGLHPAETPRLALRNDRNGQHSPLLGAWSTSS
jgi:hypothetical protein